MKNSLCYSVVILIILVDFAYMYADYHVECSTLRMGQYICPDPDPSYDYIDPKTQQPYGCTKENKAKGEKVIIIKCCDVLYIVYNTVNSFIVFYSAMQSGRWDKLHRDKKFYLQT